MPRSSRNAVVRYRAGDRRKHAVVLLDLEPGSRLSASEWQAMYQVIAGLDVVTGEELTDRGSRITVSLALSSDHATSAGVIASAKKICEAIGVKMTRSPEPLRDRS